MAFGYRVGSLPVTAIQRLPRYLRALREFDQRGRTFVPSALLAGRLRLEAIQVRKDFGLLGITGKPSTGFLVQELIEVIERCLNRQCVSEAILVGVGPLGQALLEYQGFAHHGLSICAAFDPAPERVGAHIHGVEIQAMETLESGIERLEADMAILAVAPEMAPEITDRLVAAGIAGIWNCTGCALEHPAHVVVQDEDLALGLAVLSAKLRARPGAGPAPLARLGA